MRTFTQVLGWSLVAFGLMGCAGTNHVWSSAESWYHPPEDGAQFRQAKELPDADVMEVAPAKMEAAEAQLHDVACAELSSGNVSELIGHPVEPAVRGSFFLVRAVYLNRGTGKFMVTPLGRDLLVEHGSLGHSKVPMKRQALVVRLPQKPDVVYVSCSMDE